MPHRRFVVASPLLRVRQAQDERSLRRPGRLSMHRTREHAELVAVATSRAARAGRRFGAAWLSST